MDSRSIWLAGGSVTSAILTNITRADVLFWLTVTMMLTTIIYNIVKLIKKGN